MRNTKVFNSNQRISLFKPTPGNIWVYQSCLMTYVTPVKMGVAKKKEQRSTKPTFGSIMVTGVMELMQNGVTMEQLSNPGSNRIDVDRTFLYGADHVALSNTSLPCTSVSDF